MNIMNWLIKVDTIDLYMRLRRHMDERLSYARESLHVRWEEMGDIEKFVLMAAVLLKVVAETYKEMQDVTPPYIEDDKEGVDF